jgi:hypothetical protein
MAHRPFLKSRRKQSRVLTRPRGLRFEPLEDRCLLNAGGGATKNPWPSAGPPVDSAWFQTVTATAVPNTAALGQAAVGGAVLATSSSSTAMPSSATAIPSSTTAMSSSAVATPPTQTNQWVVQLTPDATQAAGSVAGAASLLASDRRFNHSRLRARGKSGIRHRELRVIHSRMGVRHRQPQ